MIFSEWLENGLALIPVKAKTKKTFITEWTRYSKQLPDEKTAEFWDNSFSNENVALVCGEASGIVAVDIDTDNQDTHKIVPQSPYARRGKPGRETRFFKYNKFIRSQKYLELGVEIHSDNNYTLVPPSIHPDTNEPYVWISSHRLPDKDDLPELDLSFIELLPLIKSKDSVVRSGRNNTLVQIVSSMRTRGEVEEKIVNEIYEHDLKNNSPRLFTDKNEGYFARDEKDALNNAWLFVLNVTRSLVRNKKAIVRADLPVVSVDEIDKNVVSEFKFKSLPIVPCDNPQEPDFLTKFVSLLTKVSSSEISHLSIGGAFSLLSVLAANRFCFQGVWSNLYVLNIGRSGIGKSLPQDLIKTLLTDTCYLGSGNYRSSAGVYVGLSKQQNRLDVIDEASSLIKAMGSSESWQSDINELLCALFSSASSYFQGYSSRLNGEHDGFCYNPCLSLLASTTPDGFFSSIKRDVAVKGLLPRFLIFFQNEGEGYKPRKTFSDFNDDVDALRDFVLWIDKIDRRKKLENIEQDLSASELNGEAFKGHKFDPYEMSADRGALALLDDLDRKWFEVGTNYSKQGNAHLTPFFARFGELCRKISMLTALANKRTSITTRDIEFASNLIETCFHNSVDFLISSTASTKRDGVLFKVLRLIKSKGVISTRDLIRSTMLTRRELDTILEILSDSDGVTVRKVRKGSGQFSTVCFIGEKVQD